MTLSFTDQQLAAITHGPGAQLIVAGAGSGKTTVMAERIAHLANTVAPHQILGLTFSNKAAAHLRAAVAKRLGPDSDVAISTYHGFGSSLVMRNAKALGFSGPDQQLGRPPRLIDYAQSLQLLFDIFDSAEFVQRKTGNPLFILREALQLSSRLSDHLVDTASIATDCERLANDPDQRDEIRKAARSRAELIPLIEQYRVRKQHLGLIDHDDQIRLAVEAVTNIAGVADELRSSFRAVLLDEYQDTNFAQRRLLQLVFAQGTLASRPDTVTAVGDDMQSIYAFRGAHLSNLHHFLEHFGDPNTFCTAGTAGTGTTESAALPQALSQSFRNDRSILELANRIQRQVPGAQPKVLTARADADAGSLSMYLGSDSWDEARHIATHIDALIAAGTPPQEIAILCRKRRLIAPLVDALDERNIALEVLGLGGLLARPEIVELTCWLETIAQHEERASGVAVVRLLRGERYRIGVHDLAVLGRSGGIEAGLAQLDALSNISSDAHIRLQKFVVERAELREAATQLGLIELIEHVLGRTGLWNAVDGDRPMENLARFMHVADRFRPLQGRRSLTEFLTWLRIMDEADEDLSEAVGATHDAVQIMTIHQAKGLEFDHVIIPGLSGSGASRVFPDTSRAEFPPTFGSSLPWWLREDNEGVTDAPKTTAQLKSLRERNTQRQEAEEWRLLYVATTRARHSVLFSAAHWYFDTQSPQGPSTFYRWIREQTDLVTSLGESPAANASPGIGDRERRAALAQQRRADAEARSALPVARTTPKRGKKAIADDQLGFLLPSASPEPPARSLPRSLPVSAIVSLTRCARQFHWTHIQPMPRRASSAAVLGTQIHSWIEQLGSGQGSLFGSAEVHTPHTGDGTQNAESVDLDDDAIDLTEPSLASRLKQSFLSSAYGDLLPTRIEHPVALAVAGPESTTSLLIRGRVDAAYDDAGVTHVVDFKTGRPLDDDDPAYHVQLDLYGLAALQLWGATDSTLRTSAAYLRHDGTGVDDYTFEWNSARTYRAEALLTSSAVRISAGDQQPHPGTWCQRCPYLDLCPEGRHRQSPPSETTPGS